MLLNLNAYLTYIQNNAAKVPGSDKTSASTNIHSEICLNFYVAQ